MRAVEIAEPGGPEALKVIDAPDPIPGSGEVVIEVAAAGINRADAAQRRGKYPPPEGASPYPGLEVSGRIIAIGPGVAGVSVGDEVCALLSGGGYAERVAVDARLLLPIPDGVDLVDAAGLPEVAATVWSNVFQIARLTEGEMLLVHGGSGGIGTFAIQLATARGCGVLTTARSHNADALRGLGAELVIDYRDQDFAEEVATHTDGRGVDVILDHLGASYLDRNVASLNLNGRLAIISMQGGSKTEFNLGALMRRRGSVSATTLRSRPIGERADIIAAVRDNVWPQVASGQVKPVVAQRFPLADVVEAHRVLDAGGYLGKILLTT
ncbi:NAD(P)H-quinone oxidoreductase [Stackebrandtia nassauensis]|uniref:NAD(P)H quinone oxidoreductase, PIG3 family n=1 Tax=Stackebrandtia nassauensis (strain DSM 44728 / CIP 108903 / NRRL B-16338 / NBRC 102104 / LLR-40K-21) TaxID=446470 RepID=D3Q309_STANL|nr:NAD(P)H-quinone oxidoreductase [Stackebrandtia nassauensis]ADD39979.1 NAD(P)H quinone oxidoreductase, PIG3 family [Stackebrandtia nassauensis DSM 44728]